MILVIILPQKEVFQNQIGKNLFKIELYYIILLFEKYMSTKLKYKKKLIILYLRNAEKLILND